MWLGLAALAGDEVKKTWSFEEDTPGAAPRGFTPAVGQWKVVKTDTGQVLAQQARNENAVFNVALVDDTHVKDVDIFVRLKAIAAELDPGCGLVWRAKDAENYDIARYNHKEDKFRVDKVVDGVRSQPLQNADVPHHDGWTVVRLVMDGDHIACDLDGKKYLDVHDTTIADAGRIALWSKSDARSEFDDLTQSGR
jgi:hypothetical protein